MRNLWAVFFIKGRSGGTAAFNPISGGDYGYGGKIPHRADEFRAGTGRALREAPIVEPVERETA